MARRVVLCGLGNVGYRTAQLLHAAGYEVTVITRDAEADRIASVHALGGRVLIGDARSDSLLIEAGVHDASAVVIATDQDLVNVSIALDVRRLNANSRILCRLYDVQLGGHLAGSLGDAHVFSTSEVAAPQFLDAALATRHGESREAEEIYFTHVKPHHGGSREVMPGLYICASERYAVTQRSTMAHHVHHFIQSPVVRRMSRLAVFAAAVILVAAAGIAVAMGLSYVDAVYFVTTTITTVGYGDFNFSQESSLMKIFGVILMLTGAGVLAVLFSSASEALVTQRLLEMFGGRQMPRRDHVIVSGSCHVAIRIAEKLLASDIPIVLVEHDARHRFPLVLKRQVSVVEGDPRNASTLMQCNVGTARAVLAVSDDDVENLSVALAAKTLNPSLRSIARVFDPRLSYGLQEKLSLDGILSVSGAAAPVIIANLVADGVRCAMLWDNAIVFAAQEFTDSRVLTLGEVTSPTTGTRLLVGALSCEHVGL